MAHYAAQRGYDVRLWCRNPAQAEAINRTRINPRYLRGHPLDAKVTASPDFEESITFSPHVVLAVPAQYLRGVLQRALPVVMAGKKPVKFLSLAKGIEIATGKLPHQIAEDVFAAAEPEALFWGTLSGPSHAEEVIRNLPTAVVVASKSLEIAEEWQSLLNSPHFRIYTSSDLSGVELGGAVKNVIAIAVGIAEALNFGDNARAALATRGLAEIMRMGSALGASPLTLAGLAGTGDLMVTCYSHHSRNLRFGIALGQGLNIQEAASEIGQVVEGAHTVKALVAWGKETGIELPIAEGVHAILYEGASIEQALEKLLFREPRPEMRKTTPQT
jgi:glycerol-3-phosphate dehydrogenase (NAD(P)+)